MRWIAWVGSRYSSDNEAKNPCNHGNKFYSHNDYAIILKHEKIIWKVRRGSK